VLAVLLFERTRLAYSTTAVSIVDSPLHGKQDCLNSLLETSITTIFFLGVGKEASKKREDSQ
jgi:hypothetical protein